MEKLCAYPSSNYSLPHYKCVLQCCANFTFIGLPSTESDQHNSNVSTTIIFHVYNLVARCTMHGRRTLNEKKRCQFFKATSDSKVTTNLYTIKDILVMDASIVDFLKRFYIPAIHKLSLHLPHIHIIVTHRCSNTRQEVFK